MFASLSERLTRVLRDVTGRGRLTADNMGDTLREIRIALLEADVALPVVRDFIVSIEQKAEGAEITASLSPGQMLTGLVHDELVHLMGETSTGLPLRSQPPVVILMAGLQGSGKTTTVAKIARWLAENEKKSVMVASVDVYRPAAIEQLRVLAGQTGAEFFPSAEGELPVAIAKAALHAAKVQGMDVLIIDTAGRLHIDEEMMAEIREIHEAVLPAETLFTVDSMMGQDAVNTARAFDAALPLTGVVLTRTDGDARGGAALSVRAVTGKPVRFMGTGEKLDAIELFHPDRVASRILGMGDILTLVEEAEKKIDRQEAEKLAKKIKKGKSFTLEDFRNQLRELGKMGGMAGILGKLPGMGGMGKMSGALSAGMNEKSVKEIEAIIDSMTKQERRFPSIINGSRRRRISLGSGTSVQSVNKLLKQFLVMQKMMKKLSGSGGGMGKLLRSLSGRLPPGAMGGFQ